MSPCHEQAQQELPFVFFAMAFGQIHLNEPHNCDMPGFDDMLASAPCSDVQHHLLETMAF